MRTYVDDLLEELSLVAFLRLHGGSGLEMSRRLRFYLAEYLDRQIKGGVHSYPSSFNVVESFMSFDRRLCFFDLREEREHIVDLDAYLHWYDSLHPRPREILPSFLEEGVVYSYNMTPQSRCRIVLESSEVIITGVSMVRHGDDVSIIASAGESPASPGDEAVRTILGLPGKATVGKENLKPGEGWDIEKRYMDSSPEHCSVVFMARLNVKGSAFEVRYINVDMGNSYLVYTDDEITLADSASQDELESQVRTYDHMLCHYSDVFTAVAAVLFLPVFVLESHSRIHEHSFKTRLFIERRTRAVKQAKKRLSHEVCFERKVKAVRAPRPAGSRISVQVDGISSTQDGYWKLLPPGEVGEDQDGNHILGRTWVSRHESWTSQSLGTFVASRPVTPEGPDPGVVYVIRCPAHGNNVYKIGLTRRSAKARAKELSANTASPLPFESIASWPVGDCTSVEREAHLRLSHLRINPRREFFKAELGLITGTIMEILGEQPNTC